MFDPWLYPEVPDAAPPPQRFRLLVDTGGWLVRDEATGIALRPSGCSIEAGKLLARRACYALEATDEDGIPLEDWHLPFWGGYVLGLTTAVIAGALWKAATTFFGGAA